MIQSLLANFDSFWLILSQVPGALQAAINIYERNPALAVFAFVGVFLGCVAKQLVGGGDDFEIYDYREASWLCFWRRPQAVARPDALDAVVCDDVVKRDLVDLCSRQLVPRVTARWVDMGFSRKSIGDGAILWGGTGVGKTTLVKAVAQSLGVAVIHVVASTFVNEFHGSGSQNVVRLFAFARERRPCIVFIDETEAVLGRESSGLGAERHSTIATLLHEIERTLGEDIVVIGATNLLELVDEALLRPGRFGVPLEIPMPNLEQREAILRVHARGVRFDEGVDFARIAAQTGGWSGARLQQVVVSAAGRAMRRALADGVAPSVGMADFVALLGPSSSPAAPSEIVHPAAW